MKLIEVDDLHVYFPIRKGLIRKKIVNHVKAVDGVSFEIESGDTFSLVGESGCGKTTTGRAVLRLEDTKSGMIRYRGNDITHFDKKQMLPLRKEMQMIFQDPYACLNPRLSVLDIISDPLLEHDLITKAEKQDRVAELMLLVGLNPKFMNRYPHEFSGGQRQRIGIARSLALNPKFIVCDEPIAALDVSIQAQVINLLQDLQQKLELTYLFIAHDLSVVRHISNQMGVMYLGSIMETGTRDEVFKNPLHPYTKVLLSAVPHPSPMYEREHKRIILKGEIPSPLNKPHGCPLCTRCSYVKDICKETVPMLRKIDGSHKVACHLV